MADKSGDAAFGRRGLDVRHEHACKAAALPGVLDHDAELGFAELARQAPACDGVDFSVLGERPGGLAGVVKRGELADALVGEVDGRVKAQVEGLLGQASEEALERVEVALHESAQRERLAAEHDFAAFLPWRRADRQVRIAGFGLDGRLVQIDVRIDRGGAAVGPDERVDGEVPDGGDQGREHGESAEHLRDERPVRRRKPPVGPECACDPGALHETVSLAQVDRHQRGLLVLIKLGAYAACAELDHGTEHIVIGNGEMKLAHGRVRHHLLHDGAHHGRHRGVVDDAFLH